jgi:hypothetical protein
MTGPSASRTVTVKKHCAVFNEESVPVQETSVFPILKLLPEGGEHLMSTDEQLSVPVGAG